MADTYSISTSTSTHGLDAVSALAEQYMQQQYAWGQEQFQKNSELTDQVVGKLFQNYDQLSGLGGELMNMYSSMFQPEYEKLVQDANSYSSQARIQQAMGAAESGVAQAFNGQRDAALADLQSFGIDPSSGRYAQLDAAERTQQAAAQAGAGFQAEQATEATGRALRSEALQLGSVMPSQATAAYNAAGQSATAAENAKLANAQEGVNMLGAPQAHGAVAQQISHGQSQSSSGPAAGGQTRKSDSSSGSGGSNAGHPGAPGALDEHESASQADPNWAGTGGGGGGGGGYGGGYGAGYGAGIQTVAETDADKTYRTEGPQTVPNLNSYSDPNGNGQTPDDSGNYSSPEGGQYSQSADTSGSNDYSQSWDDSQSSGYDSSGDESYAEGGAIPYTKSPSHGKVTDDVRAKLNDTGEAIRLNAGEFIVPRATVRWKGEKYFQDLIARSRKEREGAGAKPTLKPALRN